MWTKQKAGCLTTKTKKMNCKEFQDMIPKERTEYIGELIHACMSDSKFFSVGKKIIKDATKMGLFAGVKINPIEEVPEILNNTQTIEQ